MKNKGQSIIEVLIGIAVGAILIVGGVVIIAPVLKSNQQVAQVQTRTELANEFINNIRAWAAGNWDGVLTLATGTANTYSLNTVTSSFRVAGNGTSSPGSPTSFGNTVFSSANVDTNPGVIWIKASTTPASNGTLSSITFPGVGCNESSSPYSLIACSNNDSLGVALYIASGSYPGTLIASSIATSSISLLGSDAYGTPTVNITAPITANTTYWFAVYDATVTSTWLGYEYANNGVSNDMYGVASPYYSFPTSPTENVGGLYSEAPNIYATYTPSSGGPLVYNGTSTEPISIGSTTYTRYFYLTDVYRDSNGNVTSTASGNSYDPSTKQVNVVLGIASSTTPSTTYTFYLTRNGNNVLNQTSWVGGSGQAGPVTFMGTSYAAGSGISITATGSIQLAGGGGSCAL